MDIDTHRSRGGWPIGRTRRTALPRQRSIRGCRLLITALVVAGPLWMVSFAPSNADIVTTAFAFTGEPVPYVVPAKVCRVRIEAIGASGGRGRTVGAPGAGARATASFAVTPGEILLVHVGGEGGAAAGLVPGDGGWNGGGRGGGAADGSDGRRGRAGSGGGGATDVRRAGDGLEHRIIVAGGGSGGAGGSIGGPTGTGGGDGGELKGHDGLALLGSANPATGGKGGTPTTGGAPGRNVPGSLTAATAGMVGVGGNGAAGGIRGGGGGGGGLYGGGGGSGGAHGGGGSGFGPPGTTFRTGVWGSSGPGRAKITYDRDTDACDKQTLVWA